MTEVSEAPEADRPKRAYRSPLRAQRAAENRRRIIEAAATAFSGLGYAGTTMAEIAARAGVSVESVYATGNKAYLLLEAYRARYTGEGGWNSIMEQEWAQEILAITDPEEGIAATVDFLVAAHERSADLWLAVRATSLFEPRVEEAFAELNRYRRVSWGESVDWLIAIGAVQPVEPHQRAALAAAAGMASSADTYLQLLRDWGLSVEEYRAWITQALRTLRPW